MKPILVYTLERTGTHFVSHCLNHIFNDVITTHDKSKDSTIGTDINYKDYKVFVTIRDPKKTLTSSLIFGINENEYGHEEDLTFVAKQLIDRQIVYFNDILDNENFYILSFEDFTTKTKDIFIKFAIDNNLSEIQKTKIKNNNFFDNPLSEILNSLTTDKRRYPRDKSDKGVENVQKTLELKEIKEYLSISESLYNKVIDRYNKQ
jgi:hypothetical protein